jgi:hypothetical protein
MPAYHSNPSYVSSNDIVRASYRSKGWGGHPASTFVPLPKGAGYSVAEFGTTRYFQVIVEASGEQVGAYAEHLFTSVADAEEFMKTLPTVLTWQQEVEYADIPLEADEMFISKCDGGLFGVFRNSQYGTRLIGEKHKHVRNACLEFWAIVEEKAQSNKKRADCDARERFTSYGESPDNFIDWVINGYSPGEYWNLFKY